MNRKELIRLAVLGEISDDYEEPTHVFRCVEERLRTCGVGVTPDDLRGSLVDLIESGLAKAYWLWGSGHDAKEVQGVPAANHFQEHYFLITDEGKRALDIWRIEWPFDEEGDLIAGWSPPSE
jgi:hypothetical protein